MTRPDGYTKAKRRRSTKYIRRLDRFLTMAQEPQRLEVSKDTWLFVLSAKDWAPWLTVDPVGLAGGLDVRFVDDLKPGRFRVVEVSSS